MNENAQYELIDTHCHLTFDELIGDIDNVITRSINAAVTGWITVGTDSQQNQKTIELAEKYGYQRDELTNETYLLWPVVGKLSRSAYMAERPIKKFARNGLEKIKYILGT